MKKNDVWKSEINPDGISLPLKEINKEVWDRGYCMLTDDGTWYEIYVNEEIKKFNESIDLSDPEQAEIFAGFDSLFLDNYADYNQITFFEPKGEKQYTLEELANILM